MRPLALLVVALFITLDGWALSFTVDSIDYSTTGTNTVEVAKGSYSGAITIPSSVVYDNRTYTVTAIVNNAFFMCTGLTSVIIPSSVTSIGSHAFSGIYGLITVDSNNQNYSSKDGILFDKNLTKLILCPRSVIGHYNIPSSVTCIEYSAFSQCTGLTSITIPSSVISIGNSAFSGCTGLSSITIPSSVISTGFRTFSKGVGLITVDSNNPNYSSKDGVLFDKNLTTLIQCPISVMGYYTIPSSVTSIGLDAFKGCTGLTSTAIPPLVTSIGDDAFYGCTGLTSITIPSSVTSIGNYAFKDCAGLASITIPSSVTSIGRQAFQGCSGLITVDFKNPKYTSKDGVLFNKYLTTLIQSPISLMGNYVIPSSVTRIEVLAFFGCTGLTSITIPSSVTSIEAFAFSDCTGLTSITVPSSVTSIGNLAFGSCGLITVDSNNANYSSKEGVLYNKNHTTLIQCPKSLMGNFNIPSSAKSIEKWAFYECNGLTSIIIPSSVTWIRDNAFYNCTSLSSLKIHTTTPPLLGKYVFSQVDTSKCVLYVPTGSLSAYKAANQWKDFKTILDFDPTGFADVNLKSFLSNRTQSYVTIELGEPSSNAQIIVVNALGQTVYECQTSDERISIDVSHFLAGIYFIDIKGENNQILRVGKFVKQ